MLVVEAAGHIDNLVLLKQEVLVVWVVVVKALLVVLILFLREKKTQAEVVVEVDILMDHLLLELRVVVDPVDLVL